MDVPTGPVRQDAELGRNRREMSVISETANTTARSRWGGPGAEFAGELDAKRAIKQASELAAGL